MKKYILLAILFCASSLTFYAQTPSLDSTQYEVMDSVIYVPVSRIDTSLVGVDVFSMLPDGSDGRSKVSVKQSENVAKAMALRVANNQNRQIEGYRIRIFFKESARTESEEVMKKFIAKYPGVPAYRSYANPYFKVTVGDFRNKSEAMQLLEKFIGEYPTAFVVKEMISYPVVDKTNAYVIDTLKVVKPKEVIMEELANSTTTEL